MGKFELAAIAVILRLKGEAYGRRIHDELESGLGKSVPMGQVYTVLTRLKEKGFLKSEVGEPTPIRGGRAKTFYSLTADGVRVFREERGELRDLVGLIPGWKV